MYHIHIPFKPSAYHIGLTSAYSDNDSVYCLLSHYSDRNCAINALISVYLENNFNSNNLSL